MSHFDKIELNESTLFGTPSGKALLTSVCSRHNVDPEIIHRLAQLIIFHQSTPQSRRDLKEEITEILTQGLQEKNVDI